MGGLWRCFNHIRCIRSCLGGFTSNLSFSGSEPLHFHGLIWSPIGNDQWMPSENMIDERSLEYWVQENLTDFLHQVQCSIDTIDYYSTGAHAKIRFKHVSNIFNHEAKIASTWLRYERFWRTHEATCRGWDPQVGAEKSAATVTRRFEQVVSSYI